jgi:hypothetical protein
MRFVYGVFICAVASSGTSEEFLNQLVGMTEPSAEDIGGDELLDDGYLPGTDWAQDFDALLTPDLLKKEYSVNKGTVPFWELPKFVSAMDIIRRSPMASLKQIVSSLGTPAESLALAEPIERILTLRIFPVVYMQAMIEELKKDIHASPESIVNAIYEHHGLATELWVNIWRFACMSDRDVFQYGLCGADLIYVPIGDGRQIPCLEFTFHAWDTILNESHHYIMESGGAILEMWEEAEETSAVQAKKPRAGRPTRIRTKLPSPSSVDHPLSANSSSSTSTTGSNRRSKRKAFEG